MPSRPTATSCFPREHKQTRCRRLRSRTTMFVARTPPAVGPIDESQLFYLESRGVPAHAAERLIALGFMEDVLERFPVGRHGGLAPPGGGRQARLRRLSSGPAGPGAGGLGAMEQIRVKLADLRDGRGGAGRRRPVRNMRRSCRRGHLSPLPTAAAIRTGHFPTAKSKRSVAASNAPSTAARSR